mmetsp:Transcript_8170/g.18685  ORF Transcript_8170/g.18685 Transcript_8170/m.18685 type:complete len:111 (+) Transcript_8170:2-334(+)
MLAAKQVRRNRFCSNDELRPAVYVMESNASATESAQPATPGFSGKNIHSSFHPFSLHAFALVSPMQAASGYELALFASQAFTADGLAKHATEADMAAAFSAPVQVAVTVS